MLLEIPTFTPPGLADCVYWENFLTEDDLQYILSLDEWNKRAPAQIGLPGGERGVDKNVRITDVAWFIPNNDNIDLWRKFSGLFAQINAQYFQFDLNGFHEPMQLTHYEADTNKEEFSYYNWHRDIILDEPTVMRKLSMTLMLSDPAEFEGGELQILTDASGAQTLEQKRGRAWFFPSWALHQVTPVTQGERKTAVLWAGGPPFR